MKSRLTNQSIGIMFLFLLFLPLISEAGDIFPTDGTASGYFGGSVSISDVYAVAGASGDNSSTGAAYVFQNTGIESYVQSGKLVADDGAASDRLGVSVSVSGVYVIAGANGDDDKGNESGSAYIFIWNGTAWTRQKKLTASDGAAGDRFGESVSISGDYAVVGSPYDDDKGADSGAAYIFKREGTTWTQQKKLIPSDGGAGDYFGTSVSISGDYALVGAHLSKNPLTNTSFGAAYIFKREATGWNQKAKLIADDGAVNDYFGRSVSLYCEGTACYAVIGADGDDTSGGIDAGSVYIFKRNSDETWTQNSHVYASDSAEGDNFGKSVSVYGQGSYWVLIAGADKDDEAGSNAGAAYIFSLSGSATWSQKEKLVPSGGGTNDYYGRSVGIFGYNTIVGAPNRDVSGKGTDSGAISAEKVVITDPGVPPPDTYPAVYNLTDQSTPKNTTLVVRFTVYDAETSAASLQVSAVSKNTTLVPQSAVVTGGSGSERTLTITPASAAYGTAVITVTVKDGNGNKTEASFTLTVNNPPTITGLDTAIVVNQNTSSGPLSFKISDEKTPASQLKLTAASSNTTLVPLGNIVFGGSDADRTVTVTPASNQTGTATITISVTDTDNDTASKSFAFSVRGAPAVSNISDKVTDEDTPAYISFTVSDADTPAENLIVSYSWISSNMSEANISLGGSGSNRKLTVIPPANEYGTARITVSVKNKDGAVTQKSFTLEVSPVNDAPTITGPSSGMMNETSAKSFSFAVGDVDNAVTTLTVYAYSSKLEDPLVPENAISITGTSKDRTLTLVPTGYGTADIVMTVNDGKASGTMTFKLTVNAKPTITGPGSDTKMDEDTVKDFAFTVGDPDGPLADLLIAASSAKTDLIPSGAITVSGSGSERRVTIKPAANKSGTAEVAVTVTDKYQASAEVRFFLTVNPVNDPPTVSWIGPQQTQEDTWSDKIPFTVRDPEGGSLTVSVTPVDTAIVPNDNDHIKIGSFGSASNYPVYADAGVPTSLDLSILPGENRFGSTGIIVTVTDSEKAKAETQFVLTVGEKNDPPSVLEIAAQSTDEDKATGEISFTVSDKEVGTLTLSVSSDNPELISANGIRIVGADTESKVKVTADTPVTLKLVLTPEADKSGETKITVSVNDGTGTASTTFLLTVKPANDPPVISNISANLEMYEDTTETFTFKVADSDTALENLKITVTSKNTGLVPDKYTNIRTEGTGANRTLTVKPAKDADINAFGLGEIVLTVDDGSGGVVTKSLFLKVNPLNDPPTISGTPGTSVNECMPDGECEKYSFKPDVIDIDDSLEDMTFSIVHQPAWASFDERTGLVSGSPGGEYVGVTTGIVITVTDPAGASASLPAFNITVVNVNEAPVISTVGNQMTDEDTVTAPIRFTVKDTEGGRLLIAASSNSASLIPNNAINIAGYGPNYVLTLLPGEERELSITITPAANMSGTGEISVTANDGTDAATTNFFLMVRAINDPPAIEAIANPAPVAENTAIPEIKLSVKDPEGGTLTMSARSDNETLVPDVNIKIGGTDTEGRINTSPGQTANLTLNITPAKGQSGTSFITVSADDGALSDSKKFLITVNYVNKAPTISDIPSTVTDEDTPVDISFTVSDLEGGAFAVSLKSSDVVLIPNDAAHVNLEGFGPDYILSLPANGSQEVKARIVPVSDKSGPSRMTVTVVDGEDTVTKTFYITVKPANDPPVISAIDNKTTKEGIAVEKIPFTVSDSEGGMFIPGQAEVRVTSSNESLVPNDSEHISIGDPVTGSGSGYGPVYRVRLSPATPASLTLTLKPVAGQSGTANITVKADDGSGTSTATSEKMFVLSVDYVNKEPVVSGIYNRTTAEDSPIDVIFTVSDVEGGGLPVTAVSANTDLIPNDPDHISIDGLGPDAVLTLGPNDAAYPLLKITPAADKSGTGKITVTVTDGDYTVVKNFYLTVTPVNDPPAISHIQNQRTTEDKVAGPITLTVGDIEGSVLSVSATSSNTALVPNDDDHIDIGGFGRTYSISVAAGKTESLSLRLTPQLGAIPSGSETGNTDITLTVRDKEGGETSFTFPLRVDRVSKPPVITGIYDRTMNEDQEQPLDLIFTVSDEEGGPMSVSVRSANTVLFPNEYVYINLEGYGPDYTLNLSPSAPSANLTLSLVPAANKFGTAVITVTVKDDVQESKATMVVNVKPVNDPPMVSAIPNQTTKQGTVTKDIPFKMSDPEGGLLSITVISSDTTLVPINNANIDIDGFGASHSVTVSPGVDSSELKLRITPVAGKSGQAVLTVTVTDKEGGASSKSFVLSVDVVNSSPVISAIGNQVTNEDAQSSAIPFTITDAEGGGLTLKVTSSDTTLIPNDDAHISIIDGTGVFGSTYILTMDTGGTRSLSLKLTPAANKSGSATITVEAEDSGTKVSKSFVLKVNPVNDPPLVSDIPNQTTSRNVAAPAIPFTVTDPEGGMFSGGMIEVTVTSSNPDIVPNDASHISIGAGFGPSRKIAAAAGVVTDLSLIITPAQDVTGKAYITVKIADGSGDAVTGISEKTFFLTVDQVNGAPKIDGNPNQSMNEDEGPLKILFTVSDAEGGSLPVSVTSSNAALIPADAEHLSIENFGLNYVLVLTGGQTAKDLTLTARPAADKFGETILTLTVKDGTVEVKKEFYVVVKEKNDLPVISQIADTVTPKNTPVEVKFTVEDKETAAAQLAISVESSDTSLVPREGMVLGGTAGSRTLKLTPAQDKTGEALISVTVSDGTDQSMSFFKLTVKSTNTAPTISSIPSPQTVAMNNQAKIEFTIQDTETPAKDLTVTVSWAADSLLLASKTQTYLGDSAKPNYRVVITPAVNRTGVEVVSVKVTDKDGAEVQASFALQITGNTVDTPPEITGTFTPRYTNEDTPKVIEFTVYDAETSAKSLDMKAYSKKLDLVPNENLKLVFIEGGQTGGPNYSLTITPVPNGYGDVEISIVADDGNTPTTAVFTLKIISINDSPMIIRGTGFENQTVSEGQVAVAEFTVKDVETALADLKVSAASSNTRVVADDGVTVGCSGGKCHLWAVTKAGQSGRVEISVEVNDGSDVENSVVRDFFFLTVGDVAAFMGDLNGDGAIDLKDAILGLKVVTGMNPGVVLDNAVSAKIGIADVIYILDHAGE